MATVQHRSRSLLIALFVLIVLIGGLLFLFAPADSESQSMTDSIERGQRHLASVELEDLPAAETPTRVARSTAERDAAVSPSATGKVYVVSTDGTEKPAPHGTMKCEVRRDGRRESRFRDESVDDGEWSPRIPGGVEFVPLTFTSSRGRFGRARSVQLTVGGETLPDVRIDWEPGIRLHCLDARTSQELTDVEVRVIADSTHNLQFGPPGSARDAEIDQRVFRGDSPLTLPCFGVPMYGWVRAPGTTWRSFGFSGCEGERVVHLEPGRELEVVVSDPHLLPRPALLSVWDCAKSPARRVGYSQVGANGRVRFDDLPASELVVCLTGGGGTYGSVLDVVAAPIAAGGTTVVEVCAECEMAKVRTGTLALEIVGDMTAIESIHVQSNDESQPRLGDQVAARSTEQGEPYPRVIDLGRYVPGRYRIDLNPAIASREVVVVAGERLSVELQGQASRPLVVTVVDADTGKVLGPASVNMRLGNRGPWTNVAFDAARNAHTATIGSGNLRLAAWLDGYASVGIAVSEAEAAAGVRIPLGRVTRYSVRIQLEESGSGVSFPSEAWTAGRIAPIAPCTGRVLRKGYGADGGGIARRSHVEWQVDQPGRYELTLPKFEGYAPLEKREIEVLTTNDTLIVVQLVPAPR